MNRETFYSNIKSWEKARNRSAIALFVYLGLIVLALDFWGEKIQIDRATDFLGVVFVLAIPACILLYLTERQAKKYGLVCKSCKKRFDQHSLLMHIAYTNQCSKCKSNVYSV